MMEESRRYAQDAQLDIDQIILEAQHRWLRPAEICEILQNFKKFRISPESPSRPPSGSLFLFDRKVLRYFRKDGHNWRKKKDGKTVKEAHERLKAGSIDVLHCYYAHGEDNQNFQRRCYWMLEQELSHIVLVHYRDVKGSRANNNRVRQSEDNISEASRFREYVRQGASQVTSTASLNSTQASEREDAESAIPGMRFGLTYEPSIPTTETSALSLMPGQESELLDQDFIGMFGKKQELRSHSVGLEEWQFVNFEAPEFSNKHLAEESGQRMQNDLQLQTSYPCLRQPVMREGLRKLDSFDRWMSKELADVAESGAYWGNIESDSNQVPLDNFFLGPSLSQDQLFTIYDFSPNWAYSGSQIMVLISGKFLRNRADVDKHRYACMFGEIEVHAEIIGEGVLQCRTPPHEPGRVPFYITCSNRLACSEVREFEFCDCSIQDVDPVDLGSFTSNETLVHMRFGRLLSLTSQGSVQNSSAETSQLCAKISDLLKDDVEWEQMLNLTERDEIFSADKAKDLMLQKLLKEKLRVWLVEKLGEDGKGPGVLDEGGQGVLHFAAALGYDWAIPPTVAAGVSVNFRDVNGWTALHWAAYYGRERSVGFLISLGAAPGALTDPTPIYPSGRTPSDLASSNGHKGIAGYLAESSLSSHLSSLDLKVVETVSERIATPAGDNLSLKDSLAAVRNATQAATRIHQVFRLQSFRMKQREEYFDSEFGISNELALSLIAGKSNKRGHRDDPVHAAVIRIQNKFRSWKGRKDFLLIRKRIIKIQAHVRGHQVRKNYRSIIWSVGILDKIILRWRRKGRGLSGFKPGTSMVDTEETEEDDYDFLKEGRKQTEERMEKALARVKSMVKYPDAQDQYRRLLNVVSEMQETKATPDKVMNSHEADFDDDTMDFEALFGDDNHKYSEMTTNLVKLCD